MKATTLPDPSVPDQQFATNLSRLAAPAPSELDELHRRLVQAASEAHLVDVAYTTTTTPVGTLLLAATERGLVRVAYEIEGHDRVLESLAARIGVRVLRDPDRLATAVRELDEYFAGRRTDFDLPLDFSLSSGFRQLVHEYLPAIRYGHTQSYLEVARAVGHPRAVRAVGSACGANPLPVVVPCHRVVRSDGALGGYLGGLEAKTTLLALERAA